MSNAPRRKPPQKQFPVERVLLVVAVVVIIYAAIRLISYGADLFTVRQETEELRGIMAATENPPAEQGNDPQSGAPVTASAGDSGSPEGTGPAATGAEAQGTSAAAGTQAQENGAAAAGAGIQGINAFAASSEAQGTSTAAAVGASETNAAAAGTGAQGTSAGTTGTGSSEEKGTTAAQSEKPEKLPPVSYPKGLVVNSRIRELRKKSEYIIGWIKMDDMEEPVVHKDNTFFLDHDAFGKKNVNGAIFMDQETNLLTRPYTIILYGHNMKSGAMFGNLLKYKQFSYCYKHRMLRFDTLYEEGEYEIFAVTTVSLVPGTSRYVSLAGLLSDYRTPRREALNKLYNQSPHGRMADVNEEDQLLLLITCDGNDDERLVVAARRNREG